MTTRSLVQWRDGIAIAPGQLRERVREEPGIAVLAVATASWMFVMGLAIWRRHDRYGDFDQDIATHVQFIWMVARGRTGISTVVGFQVWGHNATFGYFLFAPLSWLGLAGAQTLDLLQTFVVGIAVVPIYQLARRRTGIGWPAVVIALAWLLHPTVQNLVWETWHPEVMAATFILFAFVAADDWRWRRYWIFLLLALIWKIDVTLFAAMFGIWIALRRNRRVGLQTLALAGTWFVAGSMMVSHYSPQGSPYGKLYTDLGDSPTEVAWNVVAHPSRTYHHVEAADPMKYGREMLAPYGFLSILAPALGAFGLPQVVVNILPLDPLTHNCCITPHYQALPLAAATIALAEAVGWLHRRRRSLREPACALVLACGLATSTAWGSLPFSTQWGYYWSEDGDPARPAKDVAVRMIPDGAPVSAHYLLAGHLAERRLIYTFPNPWRTAFFGTESSPREDPAPIQWIVLDEVSLTESDREVERCIVAAGTFDEAFRQDDIVVLHRRPGVDPKDVECR
jgi:uncharacterized membrane protein